MTRSQRRAPEPECLSPGDLESRRKPGRIRLAGRVLAVSDAVLLVGDAFTAIRARRARNAREPDISPGDLVVVEGALRAGVLTGARVLEKSPGTLGSAGSELGRLAAQGVAPNLVARALALRAVRTYFDGEGFLEVETPIRVQSPGLDAHVDAIRAEEGWLVTSPELAMKRLLVGGIPRVFQITRVTRKGELGSWHQPEFSMVEWYRAFSGMNAVIADTEALVSAVARSINGKALVCAADGRRIALKPPFSRLTVREAFRRYAGVRDAVELATTDEDRYFQTFVDQVEPAIASLRAPVFLTEFPASQGALARRCLEDPSVVERFELYIGGIELCNGFGELTDPVEQRRRFAAEQDRRRRTGAPMHPIDERFLSALDEGLPPSGGNALGLDRLIALCVGAAGIAETMAFPT